MDGGAWWAAVHGVTKSRTWLSDPHTLSLTQQPPLSSYSSLFLKISFYRSIVALQCCVGVYCTAKWISHTYTYIPFLLDFFPIQVITMHSVEFLGLYGMSSLVLCLICSFNSVHVSIPISQFLPPSPFPLGIHNTKNFIDCHLYLPLCANSQQEV